MAIKISTADYIKTVDAEIDGVIFKVRRLGAGEGLDISQLSSKIAELYPKAQALQKEVESAPKSEQKAKIAELLQLTAQIGGLTRKIEDIYTRCFDAGDDGTKARELVALVGIDNVPKMLDRVFTEA